RGQLTYCKRIGWRQPRPIGVARAAERRAGCRCDAWRPVPACARSLPAWISRGSVPRPEAAAPFSALPASDSKLPGRAGQEAADWNRHMLTRRSSKLEATPFQVISGTLRILRAGEELSAILVLPGPFNGS